MKTNSGQITLSVRSDSGGLSEITAKAKQAVPYRLVYDLTHFGLREMTACGVALRELGKGAGSMEEVAERMVRHLYDGLRAGPSGSRSTVLVRFYKTHAYETLGPALQRFADGIFKAAPRRPDMKCLTLLATAGDEPDWNQRAASRGHQAIPLPSAEMVSQLPMVAQLVREFGLEVTDLVQPTPELLVRLGQKGFNVFHVADAPGSSAIPAQDEFVRPCGIKSALGFGGMLPSGDLFAVILFSRTPIDRETANVFQTVALNAKLALLPFVEGPIFRPNLSGGSAPAGR